MVSHRGFNLWFPTVNAIEHLFAYLLAVRASWKCLLKYFTHFEIRLFVVLLGCKVYLIFCCKHFRIFMLQPILKVSSWIR